MADAPNVIEWDADVAPLLKKYEELNAAEKKRQALVDLGGKNLGKAYDVQTRAVAAAAKGDSVWTAALKANTEALQGTKAQINQTAEGLGKFGALLGTIDPKLGALVMEGQKVTGAFSAMATGAELAGGAAAGLLPTLGALSLIAAPLAAGIYLDVQAEKDAKEAADKRKAAVDALNESLEKEQKDSIDLSGEISKLNTRYDIATGKITAAAGAHASEEAAIRGKAKALQGDAVAAVKAAQAAEKLVLADKNATSAAKDAARFAVADAKAKQDAAIKEAETALALYPLVAKAEDDATARKKAGTEATKDRAKATADANATLKAEIDLLIAAEKAEAAHYAAIHKATDALDKQAATARKAGLSETERIESERQAALAQADSIARTALMEAKTADERRDIDRALAADRVAINQQADDQILKNQQAANAQALKAQSDLELAIVKMDREANEQRAASARAATNAIADGFDALSGLYQADIDNRTAGAEAGNKADQKAILKDFENKKKAAEVEAAIQTLLAIATAAASAPPPFNLIAMGAAAAQGLAQEVAIDATPPPTFNDTPGPVVAPVQNYQPTFKKNDIIIAAQDPGEAQRQAASLGGGGSRWGAPSAARRLAQMNTGWMINDQLRLVTRG